MSDSPCGTSQESSRTSSMTPSEMERIVRAAEHMERALDEISKYAAHGCGTKQKDVRGRQFGKIHEIALGALQAYEEAKK